MNDTKITIRFTGDSRQANLDAASLEEDLQRIGALEVRRVNESSHTQDFGATLILVLGTSSVTALAHGIATWLARNSGAKISIAMPDGTTVTASGLQSGDVSKLVSELSPHLRPGGGRSSVKDSGAAGKRRRRQRRKSNPFGTEDRERSNLRVPRQSYPVPDRSVPEEWEGKRRQ